MKLHILGSSSSGNCYILETDTEALIIEAGVRISEVKKALKFNLGKVVGVVISHEHKDHSGYIKEFIASGVLVLTHNSVFIANSLLGKSFTKEIFPKRGYKVGGFLIVPFFVHHDVPCYAFIIEHKSIGKLFFSTDAVSVGVNIPDMNVIMIEANYSDVILEENIRNGVVPFSMRNRLLSSHMEITQTKDFLMRNDLTHVNNIILIHLSNSNSDERQFVKEITEITGCSVVVAKRGMIADISKIPY